MCKGRQTLIERHFSLGGQLQLKHRSVFFFCLRSKFWIIFMTHWLVTRRLASPTIDPAPALFYSNTSHTDVNTFCLCMHIMAEAPKRPRRRRESCQRTAQVRSNERVPGNRSYTVLYQSSWGRCLNGGRAFLPSEWIVKKNNNLKLSFYDLRWSSALTHTHTQNPKGKKTCSADAAESIVNAEVNPGQSDTRHLTRSTRWSGVAARSVTMLNYVFNSDSQVLQPHSVTRLSGKVVQT